MEASSKETWCFLMLPAFLAGSQSNRILINYIVMQIRVDARASYPPRNGAIPNLRRGSYLPDFLEPRRRWEQAFVNVAAEAYVVGVSTRKVESLVEALGCRGKSKSELSRWPRIWTRRSRRSVECGCRVTFSP